ncbi:hypothetical protein JTB14_021803 [Gonioctena quinquepunctata]|nr:hypothetical protein JTB14_021803 [Gonioctena quinquepunctata]
MQGISQKNTSWFRELEDFLDGIGVSNISRMKKDNEVSQEEVEMVRQKQKCLDSDEEEEGGKMLAVKRAQGGFI